MHRFVLLTGVLLTSGALVLSGCGSQTAGSTSATTSPSVTSPSASGVSTSARTSRAGSDPLATLTGADLKSILLTPAQVARFTPKMSREAPTSLGSSTMVGKGGTCPALATLLDGKGFFEGGIEKANTAQVSYTNLAAVGEAQKEIRSVAQIVQVTPKGHLAPLLGRYRAAVAGCSTPLVNEDGSRITMSLLPDPTGLGDHALALKSTYVNPPVALHIPFEAVMELAVSGPNVLSITTMGYSTKERATITAQAWKNLGSRP